MIAHENFIFSALCGDDDDRLLYGTHTNGNAPKWNVEVEEGIWKKMLKLSLAIISPPPPSRVSQLWCIVKGMIYD